VVGSIRATKIQPAVLAGAAVDFPRLAETEKVMTSLALLKRFRPLFKSRYKEFAARRVAMVPLVRVHELVSAGDEGR
jgi:hypothetical protein